MSSNVKETYARHKCEEEGVEICDEGEVHFCVGDTDGASSLVT